MIVIHLCGTQGVLDIPTIHEDCNGNLELCEDGLVLGDSDHVVYACPDCDRWLFKSSELKWASPTGYWQSPSLTLIKPYYHNESEQLTCPHCGWCAELRFFSYRG